jgi:aspartate/methionine/tyrosine aminotransferase
MAHIRPFRVMELLAQARALEAQGRSIVHMEIGEPDFDTPAPVVEAGRRALAEGRTHYTPACGLPELRRAISDHYRRDHGLEVDPGRVIVTPGGSGALQLVLSVLVDPGTEVLLPDPGYPCNRNFVHLVDGVPVAVPVDAAQRYQPDAARLAAHWSERTSAVMLASPANPTGTVLSREQLDDVQRLVRERGAHLIVDEIYHGLVYGEPAATALAVSEDLFVVNSFSKFFGMTGWRLGWVVAPAEYAPELDKLAQNIFLSAPTPAQYAALAAFTPETQAILAERRDAFRQRRDFLLPALQELGFDVTVEPDGAFYIYAGCSRFSDDSDAFCTELLDQAGVAITPGTDFGHHHARTHVRFAYTTSMEQLEEGVRRLRGFLVKGGC